MALQTGKSRLSPIYYLYGSETYLIEEELNKIKKEALGGGGFDSLNYHAYDKDSIDAAEIISAANTMPAFAERRLIVVKDALSMDKDDEEMLLGYAKDPSPTTCIVFIADTYKLDTGGLTNFFSEKGYVKAFNRLKDPELAAWIKKEAKKEGKTITDSAAHKLIELGGRNMRDIKGELDKIMLFAAQKPSIDDKDVEEAGLDCKEENIFELSDAIGAKNLKKALKIYGKLSSEPSVKVLGAISYQIRALLKLKSLVNKGTPANSIAASIGVKSWKIDDYMRRSRLFTEDELKGAIMKLSAADIGLKSGVLPQSIGLSKLIIDLCRRVF